MNKTQYKNINFIPPVTVAKEATKGLKLHQEFKKGGTAIGLARAHQLEKRIEMNSQIIKRMSSYFARHGVDKKGKDFFNKEKPSNGYIAWLLWGGDAGKKWADSIRQKMDKADSKNNTD